MAHAAPSAVSVTAPGTSPLVSIGAAPGTVTLAAGATGTPGAGLGVEPAEHPAAGVFGTGAAVRTDR